MTDYNVLFLDIDGTILQPNGTIEASTKTAIRQAQEQGLEVFLATGRPLHEIAYIAEQLDIHSFIGYNGAYASYQGSVIVNEPMDSDLILHYMKTAEKQEHDMLMYTSKQNLFTSLEPEPVKAMIDYLNFKNNDLISAEHSHEVLGVTLLNITESDLQYYETSENIQFTPVLAKDVDGRNFYDAIRYNVNKGYAVTQVLKHLNLPAESAIAFGDGLNDKEMLAVVGEGFAMENAHPSLFTYAKHRTSAVTDGGVFDGLAALGVIPHRKAAGQRS